MDRSLSPHRLVIGALQAALTLFGGQMGASILLANGNGTAVDLQFAGGVLPYLGIQTTPSGFVPLMSWSIALSVGVTVTAVMWNLLRRRDDPSLVLGWSSGLVMSLVLISLHWVRHLVNPPLVDLWILSQALAYVVAASLVFLAFRPRFAHESDDSTASNRPAINQPALETS